MTSEHFGTIFSDKDFLYMCVRVSIEPLSSCKAPGITLDIQVNTFGHRDLYSGMQRDGRKGLLEVCEVYAKSL